VTTKASPVVSPQRVPRSGAGGCNLDQAQVEFRDFLLILEGIAAAYHRQLEISYVAVDYGTGVLLGAFTGIVVAALMVVILAGASKPSGGSDGLQIRTHDALAHSRLVPLVSRTGRAGAILLSPVLPRNVVEYFQFDPFGDYLKPRFQGYRLRAGRYARIRPVAGRLPSQVLGLHLELHGDDLRFHDPSASRWLPSPAEARQQAEAARQQAEVEKQQAEAGRQQAEAESERLRRELEELRRRLPSPP